MRVIPVNRLTSKQLFKLLIYGLLFLLSPAFLWAQLKTISGTATDAGTGEAIAGASIVVKGSARGTFTNDKGNYSIVAATGETLIFSGVGYTALEKIVTTDATLSVQLVASQGQELEGVIVTTALGIKREARSLGFSQSTLDNSHVTDAPSGNWLDALSGKVAGLNMIRSGAGPAGSNKIILRGENNLTGDNEALIIVDGVVMNRKLTANGSENVYGTGGDNMPADYGNGVSDIDPQDIESVTVLKGPGAAALYGQRGANGAIIITTKSSKRKKKGWSISVNSGYAVEEVNRWPDMQFEYGIGLDGQAEHDYQRSASWNSSSAWGPKFDGQMFYQYSPKYHGRDSVRTPWIAYPNKIRNYFEQGNTSSNSVSLDGAIGKVNTKITYSNTYNKWIMPNTGFQRHGLSMAFNAKPVKNLTLNAKINYNNKYSKNLPGAGYGNQSIMYWFIFWQPNADLDWLRDYWRYGSGRDADGNTVYWQRKDTAIFYPYSSYPENPYAIAYEFLNKMNRNSITGNFSATYHLMKGLHLMVRQSIDRGHEFRTQRRPYDAGSKFTKGSMRQQTINNQELSTDFLLSYNKKFKKDITSDFRIGGSTLTNTFDRLEIRADSLKVPGIYSLQNALGPWVYIPYKSKYVLNSLYAMISASYKNYLYADLSARQDWNSVLATPTRTTSSGFFYPALNVSYILSDAYKMPRHLNFAKLRFSLSSVGSGGTTPYRTAYGYERDFVFPDSIYVNPALLINPNLKPLRTITAELGGNVELFNRRLVIDVAGYIGNTINQILERVVDRSSGYTRQVVNAGKVRNSGFELTVNTTPIKAKNKKGFEWKSNINFSTNRNLIVAMPDTSLVLNTGPLGGGQLVAKVGGSMGDLYGRGYVRSPDGQVVFDSASGVALITTEVVHLGNTIPKGKLGWQNTFTYKGFRLNLLFDSQWGAVAHSLTSARMADMGKTTVTLPGRYNGIIGNGVVQNADGTYRKNDVIATDIESYYQAALGGNNAEGAIFKTDFIKWREARLDYTLPIRWLSRYKIQRINIGVYGRDLFIWSPWPAFDPEFGTLTGSDIVRGYEIAQFPSTRTIGANIAFVF